MTAAHGKHGDVEPVSHASRVAQHAANVRQNRAARRAHRVRAPLSHEKRAALDDWVISVYARLLSFGNALHAYLDGTDLSVETLSSSLEINPRTVYEWLQNKKAPLVPRYLRLREIIQRRLMDRGNLAYDREQIQARIHVQLAAAASAEPAPVKKGQFVFPYLSMPVARFDGAEVQVEHLDVAFFRSRAKSLKTSLHSSEMAPIAVRFPDIQRTLTFAKGDERLDKVAVLFTLSEVQELMPMSRTHIAFKLRVGADCLPSKTYLPILYERDAILDDQATAIVLHDGLFRLATRPAYDPRFVKDETLFLPRVRHRRLAGQLCQRTDVEVLYVESSAYQRNASVMPKVKHRRGPRLLKASRRIDVE